MLRLYCIHIITELVSTMQSLGVLSVPTSSYRLDLASHPDNPKHMSIHHFQFLHLVKITQQCRLVPLWSLLLAGCMSAILWHAPAEASCSHWKWHTSPLCSVPLPSFLLAWDVSPPSFLFLSPAQIKFLFKSHLLLSNALFLQKLKRKGCRMKWINENIYS